MVLETELGNASLVDMLKNVWEQICKTKSSINYYNRYDRPYYIPAKF